MIDTREALMTARTSDGRAVRRPVSPHLQVYRLHMLMVLSGSHRITGLAMGGGALLMVWYLVAAATSEPAFAWLGWLLGTPLGKLALFGWTGSLWYHFCNGLRHLAWDFGYGFEVEQSYASGRMVLAAAAALTLLTWLFVLRAH
jgi:succinate dehydrogenase / fumarate reductase cytochrome b subunit